MKAYIAGIIDHSVIEWQPYASMVVFFEGCLSRCVYCHNKHILEQKTLVDIDTVAKAIKKSRELIDAVVFSGGDPLEQPDALSHLCMVAKSYNLKSGIETSGFLSGNLFHLLYEECVDAVFLDIKASLGLEDPLYQFITGMCGVKEAVKKSVEYVVQSGVDAEFRTTTMKGVLTAEDYRSIGKHLGRAGYDPTRHSYILQQCSVKQYQHTLDELRELAGHVGLRNVAVRVDGELHRV